MKKVESAEWFFYVMTSCGYNDDVLIRLVEERDAAIRVEEREKAAHFVEGPGKQMNQNEIAAAIRGSAW